MKFITKISLFVLLIFSSCASLPPSTLTLHEEIVKEGQNMHRLNIQLVDMYFDAKVVEIDNFVNNEYAPTLVKYVYEELEKLGLDNDSIYDVAILMIQTKVDAKKTEMYTKLSEAKNELIETLEQNYTVYTTYSLNLHELLAAKIKKTEESLDIITTVDDATKNKLKLDELDDIINKILIDAGKVSKQVTDKTQPYRDMIDAIKNISN